MRKITLRWLRKHEACGDQVKLFREVFPEEAGRAFVV